MARLRNQIFRPQLFWDPSTKSYFLKTPEDNAFYNDLRTFVCDVTPTYNGKGLWQIDEGDANDVLIAIASHFPEHIYGKVDFIEKPDPTKAKPRSGETATGAAKAALTMFEIGGYDVARKIYSMLIIKYHPDKNPGDDIAAEKAAAITTAWRQLKAELDWS